MKYTFEELMKMLEDDIQKSEKEIIKKNIKETNAEIDYVKVRSAVKEMEDEIEDDDKVIMNVMDEIQEKICEGEPITDDDKTTILLCQGHKEGLQLAIEILKDVFPRAF